jgi:AraC-like DNA-binding protein
MPMFSVRPFQVSILGSRGEGDHDLGRQPFCPRRQNDGAKPTSAPPLTKVLVMPRPVREPSAKAALVPALLRFAQRRGAFVRDLVARLDLPDDAADADEVAIAPAVLRALFEAVADACGEPWVGLRLAAEPPLSSAYAPLDLAVRSSRTVGDALECLALHAPLMHPQLRAERVTQDDEVRWVQSASGASQGVGRHAVEYGLAFVLARCREVCTSDPLHVRSVWFSHARPRDVAPIERFFGTRTLTFGAEESGFALRTETLLARVATRDDRRLAAALDLAAGALARQVPPARITALVATTLPHVLATGATLEAVARALAVSDRTLQRRLEEEGTTFLEVLDGVREARARDLLREPALSLVDVAERLGFSDLATFSRAFKRWTGEPPGMFRRKFVL